MSRADAEFIVPELSLVRRLGGGAFGSVWHARGTRWSYSAQRFIKDQFAVKKIPKGEGSSFTEIEVQNCLGRHPNICYLFDWMEQPPDGDVDRIWLVYEYCDAGSLNDLLLKRELPVDVGLDYCQDITSAVVYMHQHRVVHLDIKTDNILLTKTKYGLICKICDFGISRLLSGDGRECYKVTNLSKSCGPWYSSAPEVFLGVRLTDKSDIFSLGLLFLAFFMRSYVKIAHGVKLVTPFLNFHGRQGTPLHEATQDEIYYLVDYYAHPAFRHLLNLMLQLDYHDRPFVEEVLERLERLEVEMVPGKEVRSRRHREAPSSSSGPERSGRSRNVQAGSRGMSTSTVDSTDDWFGEESGGPHQTNNNRRQPSSPGWGQHFAQHFPHPQQTPHMRGPQQWAGRSSRSQGGWGHPQLVQTASGWQWIYPQQQPQVIVVQETDQPEPESTVTIEEIDDEEEERMKEAEKEQKRDEHSLVYDATLDRLSEKMKQKESQATQLKEELSEEQQERKATSRTPEPPQRKLRQGKSRSDNTTTTARRIARRMGPETLTLIQEQDEQSAAMQEVVFDDDTDVTPEVKDDFPRQPIADRIKMFSGQIPRTSSMTEKRSVFIPLEQGKY